MDELVAPTLVIAMPQLMDPNFHRTVVLLIDRSDEGAFGLVINRELEISVQSLCEDLEVAWGGDDSLPAHYGGPVGAEQGFVLHGPVDDERAPTSRPIAPGIRMAFDMASFHALCARPPQDFRMVLGSAGWAPGQLESEIRAGFWLTTAVTRDLVFETPADDLWERALETLGVDPAHLVLGTGGVH